MRFPVKKITPVVAKENSLSTGNSVPKPVNPARLPDAITRISAAQDW